jgi:hypothetical protein
MLALGLVLLVVGVLVLLAGVFEAGDTGRASLLGIHLGATSVFLLGVFAATAILLGLWCTKYGTKRSIKHARDQRRLQHLSRKLDKIEAEREGVTEEASGD